MNDKLPEPQNGKQGPSAQDPSRRRLLRAAASAAPLIATLPSGAAWATSTSQCIVDSKAGSDGGPTPPQPSDVNAVNTDGWTRVLATKGTWVASATGFPTPVIAYQFSGSTAWYNELGGVFDPNQTDSNSQPIYNLMQVTPPTLNPTTVYVLALYTPDNNTNPTTVGLCNGNTPPIPGLPNGGCVYPIAKRVPGGIGNMGIAGTCLCSVNPGLTTPGFC